AAIEIAARVAVLVADVGPGDRLERGEVAEVDRRARALVEHGRARRQRGVERIDDGQLLPLDGDERQRRVREGYRLGHDRDDRLTGMTDDAVGEERLVPAGGAHM